MNEVIARGHSAANTLCSSFHTLRRTGGQKNEQMEAFIPFNNPVPVICRVLFSKIAAKVHHFREMSGVRSGMLILGESAGEVGNADGADGADLRG